VQVYPWDKTDCNYVTYSNNKKEMRRCLLMKIPKKTLLVLSLTVLVLSFSACSKAASKKTVTEKKQTEAKDTKKTEDTTKIATKAISDDLYHFDALVNDVAYTFPTSFATFQKNGWEADDFGTTKLEPNQYSLVSMKKGDQSLMITMANFDVNVLELAKCQVAGIQIDTYAKKKGSSVSISKGITIDSTYDEVIAAYGKASTENKGDTLISLDYKSGDYSSYAISIDAKTKKVTSIEIKNLAPPEKAQTTTADTGLPEAVKNYKAPTSVGDDLSSFQVKYGENYYKLPIPIPELVKNGWVLQSKGDEIVAAQDSTVGIELRKDNQVLRTQITNYSDVAEPLKYCFATYVEYYNNGAMIHLELPKGISEKSTFAEVTAAYGQPTSTETSTTFKSYTYGKIFQETVFMVDNTTGKINKIEINFAPKTLK